MKETIESIVVAFILAFIFRCFVVEAFVIPTGSMAPTLLGAHFAYDCPDCGYHFTVGFPSSDSNSMFVPERATVTDSRGNQAPLTFAIFCPQCGYRLDKDNAIGDSSNPEASSIGYGDRILVMKYAYLLNPPARWDVVVFKSPDTSRKTPNDYSVNYIKRLIGRPEEALFVAQGDVYVADPGAPADLMDSYHIQTKPPAAQDALWRIVYDADYLSRGLPRTRGGDAPFQFPWRVVDGAGWSLPGDHGKGSTFTFVGNQRSTIAFDEKVTPTKGALTDWLAYDEAHAQWVGYETAPGANMINAPGYAQSLGRLTWPVSDLKLALYVDRIQGDGTVNLQLIKGERQFVAELSQNKVRLLMSETGRDPQIIGEAAIAMSERPRRVEFQNVDYHVSLRVDGREVVATTPQQYHPDLPKIIEETANNLPGPRGGAMISASNIDLQLSHLQLWRDVYYIDRDNNVRRATSRSFPSNVVKLGPDEYFCMGDNSFASSDGRMWTNTVNLKYEGVHADPGVVPGHFLLGRAFFVYWPAGYRPASGIPPIIPNFGQMRFIH